MSDQQIIQQIKHKNQQGITALLDKYGAALYGSIYEQVALESAAKAMMQEVVIAVWKDIDNYNQQQTKFFTWLLRHCKKHITNSVK